MRFREFLETTTGGWWDDKEDTRPTFVTRQQNLPGLSMHLGQDEAEGEVIDKTSLNGNIVLRLRTDGKHKLVSIPKGQFDQEPEPDIGDRIRAAINRDGTCQDCQIIHRGNQASQITH
jgi:hypothetical protein